MKLKGSLLGVFKYNDIELENEIKLTQEARDNASNDLRRVECLLQLLKDEKERRKNEKI